MQIWGVITLYELFLWFFRQSFRDFHFADTIFTTSVADCRLDLHFADDTF